MLRRCRAIQQWEAGGACLAQQLSMQPAAAAARPPRGGRRRPWQAFQERRGRAAVAEAQDASAVNSAAKSSGASLRASMVTDCQADGRMPRLLVAAD